MSGRGGETGSRAVASTNGIKDGVPGAVELAAAKLLCVHEFTCVCVRRRKRLRVPFPIAVGAAIPAAGANNWHQSPVHVLQRLGEPTSRALAEEVRDLMQKTGGGDLGGDDRRRLTAEPHRGRLVKHHGERRA